MLALRSRHNVLYLHLVRLVGQLDRINMLVDALVASDVTHVTAGKRITATSSGSVNHSNSRSAQRTSVLRSGWMLKKRDVLAGWRCRYM